MTTKIVLIRHGETAWNAQRRLQGHIDIGLNAEGERQAEALAEALAEERFDAIVSSDLQRACQTAQALARRHDMSVRTDSALRERCYGVFEGLLYADIAQSYPREYAAWQAREIDAVMPAATTPSGLRHAESFRQFYARSVGAILAHAHVGKTVAMVAHGGVLECAYRAALGIPLDSARNFAVHNASINRFDVVDGRLILTNWGEVKHLECALDDLV
jgi:2,3-bisphosphoglycerate-dependent phosphoglycerate mutase